MEVKLSPNLTLSEATKSQTAVRLGIDNTPTHDHFQNLVVIATKVFQKVRDHFGVPIAVTSGYRSPALNKAIGGSERSQHTKGEALDLDADVFGNVTNKEIFDYIKDNLEFDQLIWELGSDDNPAWVHVSHKANGTNRNQVLRATRENGKTTYKSYNG